MGELPTWVGCGKQEADRLTGQSCGLARLSAAGHGSDSCDSSIALLLAKSGNVRSDSSLEKKNCLPSLSKGYENGNENCLRVHLD